MNHVELKIEDGRTQFEPGAQVVVVASWDLEEPPDSLEVRLLWKTEGKGTSDEDVVEQLPLDHPGQHDSVRLGIQVPYSPYSFSGKLVSLSWWLELTAEPSRISDRVQIVIAPGSREIDLHAELPSPRDEAAE
jgi:hypothetical protein